MFTGLIEAVGVVSSLEKSGEQGRLEVGMAFSEELVPGDSVAVNGCCLTVASISEGKVAFDVLAQTLKVTSLGCLVAGLEVNLERALRVGDRLGGHLVQGHVDGTGEILRLERSGRDHVMEVLLPEEIARLSVAKGSLAVDGISLTIAELRGERAEFWITPHTFEHTNLRVMKEGGIVNLEADMLAKHVARLIGAD